MSTTLPLYMKIASDVKEQIKSGDYEAGERLPLETWFIKKYQVSRVTVRKAFDYLINEGFIERKPYKGLYVAQKMQVSQSNMFYYINTEEKDNFSFRILSFDVMQVSSKLAKIFNCDEGDELYHLQTLRFNNERPFTIQSTYLNKNLLPGLDILLLKDNLIHEIIEEKYNLKISHADFFVSVSTPSQNEAELLNVTFPNSLLQVTDTLLLTDGQVVRYGTSLYTDKAEYRYTIAR